MKNFAQIVENSFTHVGAEVVQWCCSEEKHKDGGDHYHIALKLKSVCRWKGSKQYLRERHGITVNYSSRHHNYYSAWLYVTKSDQNYKQSEGHPDLTNTCEPKTANASKKVQENGNKRRQRKTTQRERRKKRRTKMTALQISEIMLNKNLRTVTELHALAYEQKKEGKDDVMEFLVGRSRKAIADLIDTTWDIRDAGKKLEARA